MNASFLLRFKAFIIDYILIFIYLVGLFIVSIFLFPSLQRFFTGSLVVAQFTGFLLVTFPVSLYFIISDSNIGEQSFGKRKAGIKVVGTNGEALSMLHLNFSDHPKVFTLGVVTFPCVSNDLYRRRRDIIHPLFAWWTHICTDFYIYIDSHFYEKETIIIRYSSKNICGKGLNNNLRDIQNFIVLMGAIL